MPGAVQKKDILGTMVLGSTFKETDMTKTEAVVAVLVAIITGLSLVGIFGVGKYYGDQKNVRENRTISECIAAGRSPIDCRLAVKGRSGLS